MVRKQNKVTLLVERYLEKYEKNYSKSSHSYIYIKTVAFFGVLHTKEIFGDKN